MLQRVGNRNHGGTWRGDLLLLSILGGVVWLAAGFLLRDDVFIFGDHPGQYWRLWYTLNVAWPQHVRLLDWMPFWYAGYPEMHFYPPGFVLLGWFLRLVTAGTLSTAWIYEITLFVSYALPGMTFYYAMRHLRFGRRAAFAAGLYGLVFPVFWGGAQAPFIGMIGSRMAFGLNALVVVWVMDWLETRRARYAWLGAGVLALSVLAHPNHAIGILVALGLYVLFRRLPLVSSGVRLTGAVFAALALGAFWIVPLFAHSANNVVPIIRATLDETWRHVTDEAVRPFVLLALAAVPRLWQDRDPIRRAALLVFLVLAPAVAIGAMAAHVILLDGMRIYQLDPVRLLGEYYLPIIWLAAIGTAEIGSWLARLPLACKVPEAAAWGATLVPCALLLVAFLPAHVHYYSREDDEPRFLDRAIVEYRLDELWNVLRDTEGRVMFTSANTRLNARGTDGLNSTLSALAPLFTHRPQMGGTFSHWSPIAARMWSGMIDPPVLRGRVEEWDDRTLVGVPLEVLSEEMLVDFSERYGVTTLVASVNDFHVRTFLDASPRFHSFYNNGFFYVYRLRDNPAAWLQASRASVDLVSMGDDEITLHVKTADVDAGVEVKVFEYPLWKATTGTGQELAIQRDDWGLMWIPLPRGDDYTVVVRYQEQTWEQLGNLISIVALALWLGIGARGVISTVSRAMDRGLRPQT